MGVKMGGMVEAAERQPGAGEAGHDARLTGDEGGFEPRLGGDAGAGGDVARPAQVLLEGRAHQGLDHQVGEGSKALALRAIEKGIKQIAFDRGRYRYHGRIAALADAARDGGLDF